MGYRIHLNICDKAEFDKYCKTFKRDDEECIYFDLDFSQRCIELSDELDLDKFTKLGIDKDDEYPAYILKKDDIKKILDHYQDIMIESNTDKVSQLNHVEYKVGEVVNRVMFEKFFRMNIYFRASYLLCSHVVFCRITGPKFNC